MIRRIHILGRFKYADELSYWVWSWSRPLWHVSKRRRPHGPMRK